MSNKKIINNICMSKNVIKKKIFLICRTNVSSGNNSIDMLPYALKSEKPKKKSNKKKLSTSEVKRKKLINWTKEF